MEGGIPNSHSAILHGIIQEAELLLQGVRLETKQRPHSETWYNVEGQDEYVLKVHERYLKALGIEEGWLR